MTWLQASALSVSWVPRAFSRARAIMERIEWPRAAVEGQEAEDRLAVARPGPCACSKAVAAGQDGQDALDRRGVADAVGVAAQPGGVELEVEADVEQAGDVLGPLDVAADPVQVLGDPAEHRQAAPARPVGATRPFRRLGRGGPRYPWCRRPASC